MPEFNDYPPASQAAARERLKPEGFTLVDTLKKRAEVERVLQRWLVTPRARLALKLAVEYIQGILAQRLWVQVWRHGDAVRLATLEPRTMIIIRLVEIYPSYDRLFPPREAHGTDVLRGAGFISS